MRQQQDFREVHQQDLIKMKEFQKFPNSTFDEFTRQKFIEDQKIVMKVSGRVQEPQNEVNFMNDSKDFRDGESVRSGNSHVTSRPVSFPSHPVLGRDVEAFIHIAAPQRRAAMHLGHMVYQEMFLQIHMHLHQLLILKN